MTKLAACATLVSLGVILPVLWSAPPPRAAEAAAGPRGCMFAAGFVAQGHGADFRDLASPVRRLSLPLDC